MGPAPFDSRAGLESFQRPSPESENPTGEFRRGWDPGSPERSLETFGAGHGGDHGCAAPPPLKMSEEIEIVLIMLGDSAPGGVVFRIGTLADLLADVGRCS